MGKWLITILVIYAGITFYGTTREFETALSAAEQCTPALLADMFNALTAYMLFALVLLLIAGDSRGKRTKRDGKSEHKKSIRKRSN